jgi:phenylalanyl-tRNA synthetase beta chain
MDFYDLKGILVALLDRLHLENVRFEPSEHPTFHPGKCARVLIRTANSNDEQQVGVFGELHPQVRNHYDLPASAAQTPILAGDFNLKAILENIPARFDMQAVPPYPAVLEDLAIVVDESTPAEQVENLIYQAGGNTVTNVRLFDLYRGEQIEAGKKSLAYSLTYQASDRTLTDKQVAKIRRRISQRLERELGARIRSA